MEVFSGLMRLEKEAGNFQLHPGCKKQDISHLGFADDMVVVLAASMDNVLLLKRVLGLFEEITGLKLNCSKSRVYFGNTPEDLKVQLCQALEMQEAQLPMRYLGIPLTSNHLTREDYNILIQRICTKISGWQFRHLSMGGRAELIKSSIFGIQNFWCSSMPIPKYVIAVVEQKVRSFLWTGKDSGKFLSNVAWDTACLPTSEGGLGFRCMNTWAKACLCKLLWDIARKKESLWVKWIHSDRLKGQSIWGYQKCNRDPWYWKKLLNARKLMEQWCTVRVGTGENVSFWFDRWSPLGKIADFLSPSEKSSLQVGDSTPLCEVQWRVGGRRLTPRILEVSEAWSQVYFKPAPDLLLWKGDSEFSQQKLWHEIRAKAPKQAWASWLWSRYGIPRQSFVTWLLFLKKLSTKDRLSKWGVIEETKCEFCNGLESHDHLFFECQMTAQVWRLMLMKLNAYRRVGAWSQEATQCHLLVRGKQLRSRIAQLAFTTTVYVLWGERNGRIFLKRARSKEVLMQIIFTTMRSRMDAWRGFKRNRRNWDLALQWGVSHSIFCS